MKENEQYEHEQHHEHHHEHHGHEHHHEHGETGDRKTILIRIILSGALFLLLLVLEHIISPPFMENRIVNTVCYLIPYFIVGWDVIKEAFEGLFHGELLGEEFLMVLASVGAFATGQNAEGVAVLLLYSLGEFCQDLAVDRSRKSISDLMDLAPEYANIEAADGTLKKISPEELKLGDTVVVLAGERIPVDGTVLSGESMIDTSSMTGEPVPRKASPGKEVISGCINGEGRLVVRVDKEYKNSTAAKVMELTGHAAERKSKTENFITRFAHIYTPIVVGLAVLLAIVPPLATGTPFLIWLRRACTFLVISCPCALVISVPLSFFGGIGAAGRNGILVKGSNYLEALTHVKVFASDKTGTLTKGEFRVVKAVLPGGQTVESDPELIAVAALAERDSTHPIARSIREAFEQSPSVSVQSLSESPSGTVPSLLKGGKEGQSLYITGQGIHTITEDGTDLLVGNRSLLSGQGIECPEIREPGTLVYVSRNNVWLGTLIINDRIKPGAGDAIRQLRRRGVKKICLLTGDTREAALPIAETLGLDDVRAQLLPQDKVAALEELLDALHADEQSKNGKLLYAGDGINDAPVLARADIGLAMGSLGSDAATSAADIVIMDDDLRRIPLAMDIARKTVAICRQNIIFALAVKVLFLLLGALGHAGMWMAVFADVGVALLCILNSMRMIRYQAK